MSLGKKDIINNITSKAHFSRAISAQLTESLFNILKLETSCNVIKIANFGSFYKRLTPERVGRNPKTKQEFPISKRSKLFFKTSSKVRHILN